MPKYVVRYGSMRILRPFGCSGKHSYRRGQAVIVRTDRGLETGEVLCEATEEQIEKLDASHEGQILREMSGEDRNEIGRIHDQEKEEFETASAVSASLSLEMQLVDIEHIFGGERIVVYYLADGRVDFRELVKKLAGEFQTRIEMRQIGVRDEAKLMADFGDCGKAVCCNNHLVSMPPVSMKMAKLQKATLDPTKISGRCGRLKCCLRYEYETYESGSDRDAAVGVVCRDAGRAGPGGGPRDPRTAGPCRNRGPRAQISERGRRDDLSSRRVVPNRNETKQPPKTLMMLDPNQQLAMLLKEDRRYRLDAYLFVFEALSYAQDVMGMGTESPSEPAVEVEVDEEDDELDGPQRHVSGQELCEAIRRFALQQYGLMAKTVLESWGIRQTGDFGEIVFNLIRIGRMRKTPHDRREDFNDVYDFETAFREEFKIQMD